MAFGAFGLGLYILRGHDPVEVESTRAWAEWYEHAQRRVAESWPAPDVHVSTVFLGLDHSFGSDGPPILFETMIFGGEHNEETWRCSTWAQAEEQHAAALYFAVSMSDPPV